MVVWLVVGRSCRWSGARNQAAMRRLPVIRLFVTVIDRLSVHSAAGYDLDESFANLIVAALQADMYERRLETRDRREK